MDKLARVLKEVPWMAFFLILGGTSTWWLSEIMRGSITGAIAPSLIMTPLVLLAYIKLTTQRLKAYKPDQEVAIARDIQVGLIALPIAGVAVGVWCWHMGAHTLGLAIGIAFPLFALYIFLDLRRALRREQQK